MPVPSSIADLSTTPSANYPAGSDLPSALDDAQRALAAIVKQNVSKGVDIASASTITVPNVGNYFVVTGTTGISAINDAWFGRAVFLKFSGVVVLTDSAGLILPGGENITTSAGDVFVVVNESTGVWRVVLYQPVAGYLPLSGGSLTGALNAAYATIASAATIDPWASTGNVLNYTGTTICTAISNAPQAGASRTLVAAAASAFTASANILIRGVSSGNTITLAENDKAIITALSTTTFLIDVQRYDGKAIVPPQNIISGTISLSGTSVDLPPVPSWVKRITLFPNVVSTNGSSVLMTQLGDSGGVEASNYSAVVSILGASTVSTSGGSGAGSFSVTGAVAAAAQITGVITIDVVSGNLWNISSSVARIDSPVSYISNGSKTLSDVLTTVRFGTANATDTFDGGTLGYFME